MTRVLRVSLLVLLLAACAEQSRVDPDATIDVHGDVLDVDGTPLADRPVELGAGITDGEGAFAALTLGLSCTSGECRGAVRETTTDADGRYRFALRGDETQSSFGEAVSILLSATGEVPSGHVSGARTAARFRAQTEDVALPALALVDPGLVVAGDVDVASRWSTDRAGPHSLTFELDGPVPVWRVVTTDGSATVDARILEDTSGRVVVSGGHEDAIEGSGVAVTWRSPGRGYAGGAGPPPSRGRPCRFVDAAGQASVVDPCDLTDGDLVAPAATRSGVVELDLGGPLPGELVVVRGCRGGCAVEVSADGTTYRPVGAAADDFGTVALDGQPVTTVRVGLGSAGSGVREVSVWGPRPDRPALRAPDDALGARFGGDGEGDDDDVPAALAITAAVLAAVALAGAGYVIGRR